MLIMIRQTSANFVNLRPVSDIDDQTITIIIYIDDIVIST